MAREDDDEAIRLGAFTRRLDLGIVLQLLVHDLALDGGHRLQLDPLSRGGGLLGHPQRKRVKRRLAPVAVSRRVDGDRLSLVVAAAEDDRVREVLDCVDRLAVPADQHAEIVALTNDADLLLAFLDLDRALDSDLVRDPLDDLAQESCVFALAFARLRRDQLPRERRVALLDARDDPGGLVADSEQATLALGDDLEAHGLLVEAGAHPLELA